MKKQTAVTAWIRNQTRVDPPNETWADEMIAKILRRL